MITRRLALAAALMIAGPAAAAGGDDPQSYAVRVPVTPVANAALQRVSLPARVLIAARDPDLADVRMFDAAGHAVPIARVTAPEPEQRRSVALPVLPILGATEALAVPGVSLRVEDGRRASVLRVDGAPPPAGASELLGVLLDTRAMADPVSALTLDVATPPGQPITFTIERASDLKSWQPLAQKVVYRASGPSGTTTIDWPATDLRGNTLRVTWEAGSRLLSPVAVRSAQVTTVHSGAGTAPRVVLTIPAPADPHTLEFTLPFPAPITALEITPGGSGDMVVPVRILGRNAAEEPWMPVTTGSMSRVTTQGQSRTNPAFALPSARFATWRIEADARSAGFTTTPRIAARLEPAQIAFLASGAGPFTLAAGRDGAMPAFLPLADLAQANGVGATRSLPAAMIRAEADPQVAALIAEPGVPWRRVVLWGVLLAGTALLAAMVWLLLRRREPAA